MKPEEPIRPPLALIKLPSQTLTKLSFCSGNRPAAVKRWAESLPTTRVDHSSVQLYRALPEIARLQTTADKRLEMLEATRPYVHQCVQGLARQFLNQPLVLPETPLKSAVVAQALQKHLTAGYGVALRELVDSGKRGKKNTEDKIVLACHRALSGYGMMLLRSCELYTLPPDNFWLELHSLYRLAENRGIQNRKVSDPLRKRVPTCTISEVYLRILLLACARPNQMRQTELAPTFEALESWAPLANLAVTDAPESGNLFVVDLAADRPPQDKSRFAGPLNHLIRELDTSAVLAKIRGEREAAGQQDRGRSGLYSIQLTEHLEQAWGAIRQRRLERYPEGGTVDVCVGLSSLHHHITGALPFEEFLGPAVNEEIHLDLHGHDSWTGGSRENGARQSRHPVFHVKVVNSSPGGYCLEWRHQVPAQIRIGEILGFREPGRHRWGLGVIRWVRQLAGGTRLGVQWLASRATAYGAAVEHATGQFGDYRRVLVLPEQETADQPATLLTAFAPFRKNQRVLLAGYGKTVIAELRREVLSTGSVSQFIFRFPESVAQQVRGDNENEKRFLDPERET